MCTRGIFERDGEIIWYYSGGLYRLLIDFPLRTCGTEWSTYLCTHWIGVYQKSLLDKGGKKASIQLDEEEAVFDKAMISHLLKSSHYPYSKYLQG